MFRPPSITVTGADERTDLTRLKSLDCEVGILVSVTPEGRHRYPRLEWITEAAAYLPRVAFHICGIQTRELATRGVLPVPLLFPGRIQVNGTPSPAEVKHWLQALPNSRIITQHTANNAALLDLCGDNHELLVDGSGGRGILPARWDNPPTHKNVGFAGGLGPENLAGQLVPISEVAAAGWWVDMESSLRTSDDWFDVSRAIEAVERFHATLPTLPPACPY